MPDEVTRRALDGLALCLLGKRYRGVRLRDTGLTLLARKPRRVEFSELAGPITYKRWVFWGSITVSIAHGDEIVVAGLEPSDARLFVEAANKLWQVVLTAKLEAVEPELNTLANAIMRLERPRRYPSACIVEPFHKRSMALLEVIPRRIPEQMIPPEHNAKLRTVRGFLAAPGDVRGTAVDAFVESELAAMSEFFDTVESNPMTTEQRLAIVTDEDATLVLAGAGSGKTSVVVAKAAYLLSQSIRQPNEILLLAFGKAAADEMSTRIKAKCGIAIDAKTFHALGNQILANVQGDAPALAPEASDDAQFNSLLRDIMLNDLARNPRVGKLLLKWFSDFYRPYKSEWDFKSKDEYYRYVEKQELRTLKGELVKSFEELTIANWLFSNGIEYEYEPTYEHELPKGGRRVYTPDFRLKASGVYIEHFGVRRTKGRDGTTRLTTAPYIDTHQYLQDMEWKREIHEQFETVLIETYSYERVEGSLTESLQKKIEPYVQAAPISPEQTFGILSKLGQIDSFTKTLGTFLRLFKGANLTVQGCRDRCSSLSDPARGRAFLEIFEPALEAYRFRLGDRIDFEDMIATATDHVRSGRYKSPYRHILVDEFQDLSAGCAQLLQEIKRQQEDARVFAVGDDWQSIYRFTGADIHYMRSFGDEFGGHFAGENGLHSVVNLGRTFRSVDKIALPARRFVLQNPSQIERSVVPAGSVPTSAISVAYSSRAGENDLLSNVLAELERGVASGETSSVLLLGRYRYIRPAVMRGLAERFPKLSVKFLTVHSSKGLEADHVIILQARAHLLGFPCEITDDPLLDLVLPEPEQFENAEERRLFYVALTRARRTVTILADQDRPSEFVIELVDDPEYDVVERSAGRGTVRRCQSCGGRLLEKLGKSDELRFQCEHKFLCGESLPSCSACNRELPVEAKGEFGTHLCICGERYSTCPSCEIGWLVPRTGRHGEFLGCVRYPSCTATARLEK